MGKNQTYDRMSPLANWRDPTQYPDPLTATTRTWVWQFMRRNHQYRRDWEEERSLWPRFRPKSVPLALALMFPPEYDTPDIYIPSYFTKRRFTYFLDQYGLERLFNPSIAEPDSEFLDFRFPPGRLADPVLIRSLPRKQFEYCFIQIDLRYGLERQFLLASHQIALRKSIGEKTLDVRLEPPRHNVKDPWLRFLRVLDAREAGASYGEIAAEVPKSKDLHGNDKYTNDMLSEDAKALEAQDKGTAQRDERSIRDTWKSALRMRDGEFRYVMLQVNESELRAENELQLAAIEKRWAEALAWRESRRGTKRKSQK